MTDGRPILTASPRPRAQVSLVSGPVLAVQLMPLPVRHGSELQPATAKLTFRTRIHALHRLATAGSAATVASAAFGPNVTNAQLLSLVRFVWRVVDSTGAEVDLNATCGGGAPCRLTSAHAADLVLSPGTLSGGHNYSVRVEASWDLSAARAVGGLPSPDASDAAAPGAFGGLAVLSLATRAPPEGGSVTVRADRGEWVASFAGWRSAGASLQYRLQAQAAGEGGEVTPLTLWSWSDELRAVLPRGEWRLVGQVRDAYGGLAVSSAAPAGPPTVEVALTAAGLVSDFGSERRAGVATIIAELLDGVSPDDVAVTVRDSSGAASRARSRRALQPRSRRSLQPAQVISRVEIVASVAASTSSAATAAEATLGSAFGTADAATDALSALQIAITADPSIRTSSVASGPLIGSEVPYDRIASVLNCSSKASGSAGSCVLVGAVDEAQLLLSLGGALETRNVGCDGGGIEGGGDEAGGDGGEGGGGCESGVLAASNTDLRTLLVDAVNASQLVQSVIHGK